MRITPTRPFDFDPYSGVSLNWSLPDEDLAPEEHLLEWRQNYKLRNYPIFMGVDKDWQTPRLRVKFIIKAPREMIIDNPPRKKPY